MPNGFRDSLPTLLHTLLAQQREVNLRDGSWYKLRVPKSREERPYFAKVAQAYHMTVRLLQVKLDFTSLKQMKVESRMFAVLVKSDLRAADSRLSSS